MIRHYIIALALLIGSAMGIKAQELLNENFEDATFPPVGWSVKQTDDAKALHHWGRSSSSPISGKADAWVQTVYNELLVKEEWLITPEIQVPSDGDYSFQFKWYAQRNGVDKGYYDFIVKISTDDGTSWTPIWGVKNDEQVENSGVTCPWKQWTKYTSDLKLSAWKGQKVKLAFYYTSAPIKDYCSGSMAIDEVKVVEYVQPMPVVEGSTSYKFENVYVGVSKGIRLTLKNAGASVLNVTNISGLENTDFSTKLSAGSIALKQGEETTYIVMYNPTLTGSKNATLKIETNGGILDVVLEGTKTMLPTGYTLESFESGEIPPLGWTNSGWILSNSVAISGSHAVTNSILQKCYLTSPRLNLSTGGYKVIFDFIEDFNDETGMLVPENDFILELKVDDGEWKEVWYADELRFNEIIRKEIDLSKTKSNNCYLRWSYVGDFSGGFETVASSIFIDDIVLPPVYGENKIPVAVTNPRPVNTSEDCDYTGVFLSWEGSLFADGYKLYLGTNEENPHSVINGETLTETNYLTEALTPSTTYFWKVVPFNETGDCADVPTWKFTTMPDQTISEFPYMMEFEGEVFPHLGWKSLGDGKTWQSNSINPHGGSKSCSVFQSEDNKQSMLQTPLILLPSEPVVAAFWWAKEMPVRLNGTAENAPVYIPAASVAGNDTLYFEIKTSDQDWKELARTLEEKSWIQAVIPLDAYASKQVWLRWRYAAEHGYYAKAGALDDLYIGDGEGLGISTATNAGISVYPTLVTDMLYMDGTLRATATLYDLTGNVMLKVFNVNRMDVSTLGQGAYILSIKQQGYVYNTRIIKK